MKKMYVDLLVHLKRYTYNLYKHSATANELSTLPPISISTPFRVILCKMFNNVYSTNKLCIHAGVLILVKLRYLD